LTIGDEMQDQGSNLSAALPYTSVTPSIEG
jgi:hypothetical protein